MPRNQLRLKRSNIPPWKRHLKKFWWFIWEDDSIWSWIVNVVLAFVIIKFLLYPGLGLGLSTSHPIVAVVSSSMEHDGSFDDWWDSMALCDIDACKQYDHYALYNISKEDFTKFSYKNGFNTGDIMILYGTKPHKLEIGDVIVFQANRPDPIIHRIIKIEINDGIYHFTTKGDHNHASFTFEQSISEDRLIGRAVSRIPYLGYIKLSFVRLLQILHIG